LLTRKITLGQLVLRWTVGQPGITIALVGARNAEQAIANAKAFHSALTGEELNRIDQELLSLELQKS
jgi:aryl-alcohol dehydrogenase-like predicted oxidoreductase